MKEILAWLVDEPEAVRNLVVEVLDESERCEFAPETSSAPQEAVIFAAASAQGSTWAGAALFVEQGNSLVPIGNTGSRRSVTGQLASPLSPSPCMLFEPNAVLEISGVGEGLVLESSTVAGLANGANRLCVGNEVLQFVSASDVGSGEWQLKGLLRGRGGTEDAAATGHAPGASVVLLDEQLSQLDSLQVASDPATRIAAIGRGDESPVFAALQNAGLSRRPPMPVHPQVRTLVDGSREYCWTRRARGQWRWDLMLEVPLVEQSEAYLVGFGPFSAPHRTWSTAEPRLTISPAELSSLLQTHGPDQVWVQQIGTFAMSPPLKLAQLP